MNIIDQCWSFEEPIDGFEILKKLERAGRTCYKSEDRITDDSAKKFVAGILKSQHLSVIEHHSITVRIITDRGVTHEIVRHRIASYCLSGDTVVRAYRHPSLVGRPTKKWTLSQLFKWQTDPKRKGRIQLIRLRSVDKNGCIVPNQIKSIIESGVDDTYEVKTKSGRILMATLKHRFLTPKGYVALEKLSVGSRIIANGGRVGMHSKEGLRKLKDIHMGELNPGWKGDFVGRSGGYRRTIKMYTPDKCWGCSETGKLERHHIDGITKNIHPENILFLCQKCHKAFHIGAGVLKVFNDEIISLKFHKKEKVYDVEMSNEPHNFVANGLVVHNSQESTRYVNYEKKGIQFIRPVDFELCAGDIDMLKKISDYYCELIEAGYTPQQARYFLPNGLKTEIVMTANLREWRHFFTLRASKPAHPQMRALAGDMLLGFQKAIPVIFDDLKSYDNECELFWKEDK